jgi:hypothetical protein
MTSVGLINIIKRRTTRTQFETDEECQMNTEKNQRIGLQLKLSSPFDGALKPVNRLSANNSKMVQDTKKLT